MNKARPSPEIIESLLRLQQESAVLMALFDDHDMLCWSNCSFRSAYCVAPDAGQSWSDIMRACHSSGRGALIETEDIEVWLAAAASRRGKSQHRSFEADFADGRWLWIEESSLANGWMLFVGSDISELRQDQRALRQAHVKALRASQTDGLTGLCNRVHALHLLRQALNDVKEHPVCVAVFDLDQFKAVNDTLGHAGGDIVIRDFARLLQATVRRRDSCGRIGGEEFLLVLSSLTFEQARDVIARLLEHTRASRPLVDRPDWGYTCSAGLTLAMSGETVDAVVRRADEAMYRAKASGRDRLVCDA
jgi:diguanylate cyclase (GGDEF)-like protein